MAKHKPYHDAWVPLRVPGRWDDRSGRALADYDGYAWYRAWAQTPPTWAGQDLTLTLERIDNCFEVYFNGERIGGAGGLPPEYRDDSNSSNRFTIPASKLSADGPNLIAVRVYDNDGNGGFEGAAPALIRGDQKIVMDGDWQFRIGDDLAWAKPAGKPDDRYLFSKLAPEPIGAPLAEAKGLITLPLRSRDAQDRVTVDAVKVKGSEIAIVVMDMWDSHWDPSWVEHAGARAESINRFLHRARSSGAVVIHSPTNLIKGYGGRVYQDTKQRQAAAQVPHSAAPRDNGYMPKPAAPWGKNREVGSKPQRMNGEPATRPNLLSNQCIGVDIGADDYITGEWGTLQDAWNILQKHNTKYLLYVGGATNMCLLMKPIGLRHMKARGVQTLLVRDLAIAWSDPYHWFDRNKKLAPEWGYTPLKADAFVADWVERNMSPSVTSAIFSGPAPRTLKLANASATHSSTKHEVGQAIDGSTTRQNGWAIGSNIAKNNVAVFELAVGPDNRCGERLEIVLQFASHEMKHSLGKFRLSVTADDRVSFADGKSTGGDVEAKWSVLHPTAVRTLSSQTSLQIEKDGTIRCRAETVPDHDCYYIEVSNPLGSSVTGFRLEALADDSLPSGGPGLSAKGNFVLGEINVRAQGSQPITTDWDLPADKKNFHVFLLMGQSNMTGGRPTLEDVPNLFFIPQPEKDWTPAQKGKMQSYALGVEFAKNYMRTHPGVSVGLIPAAKGGASIGALHKGSTYYSNGVEKATAAMKSGVIKGVLWHQGESDTVHPHLARAYEDKLIALVKDLRADLKDEKLPFVVGDLGEFYGTGKYHIKNIESIDSLRKVLRGLPSKLPYTAYSDSAGCEHRGDFVHFDAKANIIRGKKYAEAYERALEANKPQTQSATPPLNNATRSYAVSARGVFERVMGEEKANTIVLEALAQLEGRDVYEYQSSSGKLIVRGSSPAAMCRGAYDYLRANNMGTVGWAGPRMRIPESWPDAALTRVETPFRIRHCYNVCTAGYTFPYWTWPRWEQELDWLAMHGFNMIMAPVGTEAVATEVWKSLGLTQEEIDDFYTGPAHLPWQRMGNIQNVGGTLPPSWHRDQVALQKKILARMRELGIEPVVQGFAGFVPKGIARVFPNSKLHGSAWGGFKEKSQSVSVMPDDPLFAKIMKLYMTEWKATFGEARYFLVDSFNEMELPKTGKPATELLAGYGRNTYDAIKAGDPDAVWVLQGWMFYFQRNIWNKATVKALLGAVPDDRLMILDYANDYVPTWGSFNAFDGKSWVMGYVPNMGGKTAYTGKMDFYAKQVAQTLQSKKKGNLTGFTISGEGLENNEVIYELMSDTAWSAEAIDVDTWLPRYVKNRYGKAPKPVLDAWQLLRESVYSTFSGQPRFGWQTGRLGRGGAGSGAKFREAVQLFLSAAPELRENLNYRDDAIEMAAFALGGRADECFLAASQAVGLKRPEISREAGESGFQLLRDLDRLLASHSFHRLDRWIGFARSHGDTKEEQDNYERNARQIVSVWGPPINDYSCRVWSGLIRDYYLPRVRMKLDEVQSGKRSNRSKWEAEWVNGNGVSKIEPFRDPVEAAVQLVEKALAEKPSRLDESVGPVIGRWSAADLKDKDWHTVEWDMPMDLLKDIQGVQFVYESGYSYLEIRSAELIGDGKQVAIDRHLGRAGGTNVKNFYALKLPAGVLVNNSCLLRAEFKSPTASSYGSIRAITKQTVEKRK